VLAFHNFHPSISTRYRSQDYLSYLYKDKSIDSVNSTRISQKKDYTDSKGFDQYPFSLNFPLSKMSEPAPTLLQQAEQAATNLAFTVADKLNISGSAETTSDASGECLEDFGVTNADIQAYPNSTLTRKPDQTRLVLVPSYPPSKPPSRHTSPSTLPPQPMRTPSKSLLSSFASLTRSSVTNLSSLGLRPERSLPRVLRYGGRRRPRLLRRVSG
jgi:hypothetical protein